MKAIIAILSCHRDRAWQQAQRDTWLGSMPAGLDYAFFLGRPYFEATHDEVFLDVPDDSLGLPYKTRTAANWALSNGYDFMFKCDIDTWVNPELMLTSEFEKYPFTGGQNSWFASGGSGYWLDRESMQIVASSNPDGYGPAEDVFVAFNLRDKGITVQGDRRYKFYPGDILDATTLTYHLSSTKGFTAKYTPDMMYRAHEHHKNGVSYRGGV